MRADSGDLSGGRTMTYKLASQMVGKFSFGRGLYLNFCSACFYLCFGGDEVSHKIKLGRDMRRPRAGCALSSCQLEPQWAKWPAWGGLTSSYT